MAKKLKMLSIDREFAQLCPALTDEEFRLLEQAVITDGCREPITVWDNTIVDGHNRYKICVKHRVPFKTRQQKFSDRSEAISWIINNQFGRRNITEEQKSYLRGKRYWEEKKQHGGDRKSDEASGQIVHLRTAESIGEEYGVNEKTIRRDAEFAASLDALAMPIRNEVLAGESELTRPEVVAIAELPKDKQKALVKKGSEAVKKYKDKFDTASMDKQLKRDKKPGSVKPEAGWNDRTLIEAVGKFAKQVDAAFSDFRKLFEDCHANVGGARTDVERCIRASKQGQSKSQEALDNVVTAFRMWRPKK